MMQAFDALGDGRGPVGHRPRSYRKNGRKMRPKTKAATPAEAAAREEPRLRADLNSAGSWLFLMASLTRARGAAVETDFDPCARAGFFAGEGAVFAFLLIEEG